MALQKRLHGYLSCLAHKDTCENDDTYGRVIPGVCHAAHDLLYRLRPKGVSLLRPIDSDLHISGGVLVLDSAHTSIMDQHRHPLWKLSLC